MLPKTNINNLWIESACHLETTTPKQTEGGKISRRMWFNICNLKKGKIET